MKFEKCAYIYVQLSVSQATDYSRIEKTILQRHNSPTSQKIKFKKSEVPSVVNLTPKFTNN
jgi:hypothetical protein